MYGTLSKLQLNHKCNSTAMYMTFVSNTADSYWIMFDGTSAQGSDPTTFQVNNTGDLEADFELLDGGAYVRTEFAPPAPMAIPIPWPILATQHLIFIVEGTEFVVQNTDPQHNECRVYLIDRGPLRIVDADDPTNAKDMSTPNMFLVATYDAIAGRVNFSAEKAIEANDLFFATITDNADNLCV